MRAGAGATAVASGSIRIGRVIPVEDDVDDGDGATDITDTDTTDATSQGSLTSVD